MVYENKLTGSKRERTLNQSFIWIKIKKNAKIQKSKIFGSSKAHTSLDSPVSVRGCAHSAHCCLSCPSLHLSASIPSSSGLSDSSAYRGSSGVGFVNRPLACILPIQTHCICVLKIKSTLHTHKERCAHLSWNTQSFFFFFFLHFKRHRHKKYFSSSPKSTKETKQNKTKESKSKRKVQGKWNEKWQVPEELRGGAGGLSAPKCGKPGSSQRLPVKASLVSLDLPAFPEKPEKSRVLNAGNDFQFPKRIMKAHPKS